MNKLSKLCLGLCALGITYGCSDNAEKINEGKVDFVLDRVINLPLDSVTSSNNRFYQIVENDSCSHLYFWNELINGLYVYDLKKESFLNRYIYEIEGPNGLGSRVTSFQFRVDSTVIFHSYYRSELIHTDLNGSVISRIDLKNLNSDNLPTTGQSQPFIIQDSSLLIYSGKAPYGDNFNSGGIVIKKALYDSIFEDSGILLPEYYRFPDGTYYPRIFYSPSLRFDNSNQNLLVSFPFADSLQVIDDKNNVSSKYFGTPQHKLRKPINLKSRVSDPMQDLRDIRSFSNYGGIYHDPINGFYLRTFYDANTKAELEAGDFYVRQQIIIADNSFDVLGVGFGPAHFSEDILFSKLGLLQVLYDTQQEDSLRINVLNYEVILP